MKRFIKDNCKLLIGIAIGLLISTTGVIAATILTSSEVSYNGNKVPGANTVQEAIDTLYTKASTGSDCRNGYQKQIENGSEYSCSRTARQCSGDNCILCKRAERLHTIACSQSSSNYCAKNNASGATLTYGNQTTTSGVLNTGDAFDCDVNGDGSYDSNTERFYYVSTKNNGITVDPNMAVLIYYSNTIGGEPAYAGVKWYATSQTNENGPETARNELPTESQWSNVQLSQTVRDITYNNNTVRKADFSYEGYAARLLTYRELYAGCYDGVTSMENGSGLYTKCEFLFENTKYENNNNNRIDSFWLETPNSSSVYSKYYVWIVNGYSVFLTGTTANSSTYGVRPVIEVSLSDIEY